jgi:glutathione peroxidase
MKTVFDFNATTLDGSDLSLETFRSKMLLIVNVASKCGFTPQYAGLETLYRKYADKGFVVLGFPCDQFGHQEPGNAADIKQFCSLNYDISFPLFAKIEVNGGHTHPLYQYLKSAAKGLLGSEAIKWNFTKFLVDRNGRVLRRYAPTDTPEKIEQDLTEVLASPGPNQS